MPNKMRQDLRQDLMTLDEIIQKAMILKREKGEEDKDMFLLYKAFEILNSENAAGKTWLKKNRSKALDIPEAIFRAFIERNKDKSSVNSIKQTSPSNPISKLLSVLRVYTNSDVNPFLYFSLNGLGLTYLKQNKIEEAIKVLRQAANLGNTDPIPYYNLGIALINQERYVEAEQVLRKSIKFYELLGHEPEELADAYLNLGVALINQRRYEEAENSFRKSLEISPSYLEGRIYLSSLLRINGRYEEAEKLCREALGLNPRYMPAYEELVSLMFFKKDVKNAFIEFYKAAKTSIINLLEEIGYRFEN